MWEMYRVSTSRPLLSALLSALVSRPSRNSALFLGHRPCPMLFFSFLAWLVRPTPPAEKAGGERRGEAAARR
jgi:hypothetical protein